VTDGELYNWRCTYGGMDPDAAKELKALREQNTRLKRLLADAELDKDALREVAKGKFLSPAAKRRAVDMRKETLRMSERLACKAVGLARSTYRRQPLGQTPADPDAEMRAWLRAHATKPRATGSGRAWAALRYDERREVKEDPSSLAPSGLAGAGTQPAQAGRGVLHPAGRGGRLVRGVGDRLPVRLHHRRQGHQDRLDDR
jgi:hypothetical protein